MSNDDKRRAALNDIRQNIAEYGYHTYVVTGGGYPHFGYTIGLRESLGAELILAGAYFYELDQVSQIIKRIARELHPPVVWETQEIEAGSWGTFSLRDVGMSWAKGLMLGVFDYYQVETVRAYQIVPDEAHRTVDVPDMNQPWNPALAPAWRWLYEEWPYPVPKKSVAFTDLAALKGERITEAARWEEDEWELFAGAGPDVPADQRRVVPIGILLGADPSLAPVVDLPIGGALWRDGESDWHRWGEWG